MAGRTQQGQIDEATLAHAALLYYGEGLTQSEVASRMGVSRATIVGYLRAARDARIVDIRIQGKSFAQSTLATALKDKYQLEDVFVAPGGDGADGEDRLTERVAALAAMSLSYLLEPDDRLGVAWGRTIQHLAFRFPKAPIPGLVVYQMIGSMHSNQMFSAENCSIEIARRTHAECRTLHVPAIVSSAGLARALRDEPQIHNQFDELRGLTKVVFSVGDVESDQAHVVQAGIASVAELRDLRAMGAAGVICCQFIDAEGGTLDHPLHDRILSTRPEDLLPVPFRMMVVAGEKKRAACLAALRGRMCSHLVADEAMARWLLRGASGAGC